MAPDPLARLGRLGRSASDRTILAAALGRLDAEHALRAKIAAEPHLEAILDEFVTRLIAVFPSLGAVRGRRVLDIACGSNNSRSPVSGRVSAEFEPWMCRLLLALGADPLGIDIGDLAGEAFEHRRIDLGQPGALDVLPSAAFDAVHESRLFGSPEFRAAYGRAAAERIRTEIRRQERRLLRPGGDLIHSDMGPREGRRGATERRAP